MGFTFRLCRSYIFRRRMPSATTSTQSASPQATLFVVSAVQFLTPFLASSVSVALPVIGREFNAGAMQLSLVQLIYILAVSSLLLPIGRYADIHGRKKIFILGIILLTVATLLITTAASMGFFLLYRFIQGLGAAMITSTSIAILTSVYPKEKRGKAMGIIIGFVYIGLAAGPTLSGFLITQLGWRWVFWAILPVEGLALLLTLAFLHGEWTGAKGEAFDLRGTFLYILSLGCMMIGGSLVGKVDYIFVLALLGMLGMAFFVHLESQTPSPLINIRLLRTNLTFTFNNIATLINYAASFGLMFLFSLYLQEVKGLNAQQAGFILIVQPAVQAMIAPFAGKLSDRYKPSIIATTGMLICTIGLGIAATLHFSTPLSIAGLILFTMGIGFGLFSSPNMVAIMGSVEPKYYGVASSIVATMRSLGMLVSMALITVVIGNIFGDHAINEQNRDIFLTAMRISFIFFTCMGITGIIFSLGKNHNPVK